MAGTRSMTAAKEQNGDANTTAPESPPMSDATEALSPTTVTEDPGELVPLAPASASSSTTISTNTIERSKKRIALAQARYDLVAARLALLEAEADLTEPENGRNHHVSRPTSPVSLTAAADNATPPPSSLPQQLGQSGPLDEPKPHTWEADNKPLADLATAILEVARGNMARGNQRYGDLPYFGGQPTDWLYFKTAFIESCSSFNEMENRSRLRKALKGTALDAVKCLFLGNTTAREILQSLEARFGRPHALITSELDKLRLIPKLIDNPKEICIFASKVNNIIACIKAINKVEYLYNPEITNIVSDKLPAILRHRWYEFEFQSDENEPGLITMNKFLNREAELNSRHAKADTVDDRKTNHQGRAQQHTFKINSVDNNETDVSCTMCQARGHQISSCSKFKSKSISERWDIARTMKLCFRCLRKRAWQHRCKSKRCDMSGCQYFHHRLLHETQPHANGAELEQAQPSCSTHTTTDGDADSSDQHTASRRGAPPAASVASTWTPRPQRTYLKVLPVCLSGPHGDVETFALLDDGSTVTLLTAELAHRIGVEGPSEPFFIEAVAGARIDNSNSQRVKFAIRGKHEAETQVIEARTIDHLDISTQTVSTQALADCNHLTALAEQLTYEAGTPAILIGQDNWALLLASEVRRGSNNQPIASHTPLGWVLHGKKGNAPVINHRCNHASDLEQLVQEHFKLESLGVEPRRPKKDPEIRALDILQRTTRALPTGGYETGLLWKEQGKAFPNNYSSALKRLEGVEKRLQREPELQQSYKKQIITLLENGYAEISPTAPPTGQTWYLPHFPVLNPAKPGKVRIVHDAAARTKNVCLNDYLLTGPDLLQSLLGVLMRFRQKPVAVAADIKDMFLRIKIREQDRDALRFLWRDDPTVTPTQYRMTSVLFGATCSPSTAIYVKNHNAREHSVDYPEALSPIIDNHYMDDYLQSFDDAETANRVSHAVDTVHRRGNFELQKWTSNNMSAIAGLTTDTQVATNHFLNSSEKILGLVWRPANDTLGFNLTKLEPLFHSQERPTKRQVLKTAMTLYDPLGLIVLITIQAKRVLQDSWRQQVDWDEPLPETLVKKWQAWLVTLQSLKDLELPRCYPNYGNASSLELHVFVDASESTYAAVAYWRILDNEGIVTVSLAAAKGRVAPLKVVSIPRLELQAAVLGGRLLRVVEEEHSRPVDRRVLWSDSRTVLAWLRAPPRTFKPFVAHRLAELEETTSNAQWRWVPTTHNVADDATRDAPIGFTASHRWFCGPEFLRANESTWPREENPLACTDTGEERHTTATVFDRPRLEEALPDVTRFSSWLRLIRSTARVLQFIERCRALIAAATRSRTRRTDADECWGATRRRRHPPPERCAPPARRGHIPLTAHYTRRAELLWARALQEKCFGTELRDVTGGRAVSLGSRLRKLSIRMDPTGVIRLHSRTTAVTDVVEDSQSPIILDGDHAYCRLYIDWTHRKLHHSGVECVVNEVRQHYWVLRLRPTVRNIIKRCQPCRLRRATPPEPPTGDLPPCRLAHHRRPFTYTGLDYFGPLTVTVARHHEKRYVALFTCLTSRAVHLEVASTLSADAAVLALRRMIARRGCPDTIWSDNGTNFHGADSILRKAALTSLQEEADVRHISWRYIPPGAPFMGGAWERLVRSVTTALLTTLHERHPQEDVLHTLLTEVEHTINSRPLSHVSVSPEDEDAITPNHFLLGGPSRVPLPGTFTKIDEMGRSHWRASQRLADLFWNRWVREVLPLLQNRREPVGRGEPVKKGDVVVVVDATLPRNVWPKGRVERLYPGKDGIVRVVDIKTKSGVMRRPVKRLVILPVDQS